MPQQIRVHESGFSGERRTKGASKITFVGQLDGRNGRIVGGDRIPPPIILRFFDPLEFLQYAHGSLARPWLIGDSHALLSALRIRSGERI